LASLAHTKEVPVAARRRGAPARIGGRLPGSPQASVLALQRAVGNQAFGSLLPGRADTAPASGLPPALLAKMQTAFGTDFSDVRVDRASPSATALGALAYTQGSRIHVAPGHWAPQTPRGQELIGHELAHVVQQRAGRVRATAQFKGVGLNDNAALESEAESLGARAARTGGPPSRARAPVAAATPRAVTDSRSAPVQRYVVKGRNQVYETSDDFLRDFIPRLVQRLGAEQTIQIAQRLYPQRGTVVPLIRRTLTLWLGDGNRRTLEECVAAAAELLGGPAGRARGIGAAPFEVNPHSGGEDLLAQSSDFPSRRIATNLSTVYGMGREIVPEYVSNPTARTGGQALSQGRLHPALGQIGPGTELMWVVSGSTGLTFGTRPANVRRPHPTLIGGVEPQLTSGGTITPRSNRILEIRDDSGHFQPGRSGIESSLQAFHRLPSEAFHPAFQGFRPFGGTVIAASPIAAIVPESDALRREGAQLTAELSRRMFQDGRIPAQRFAGAAATVGAQHLALINRAYALFDQIYAFLARYKPYLRASNMVTRVLQLLTVRAQLYLLEARLDMALAHVQRAALAGPNVPTLQELQANHLAFQVTIQTIQAFEQAIDGLIDSAEVPSRTLGQPNR
jgi:hypothetical protein